MRSLVVIPLLLILSGCSSTASPAPTATPATSPTASVATAAPSPTHAPHPPAAPTPTVAIGRPYRSFVSALCGALTSSNADTVINSLPYYQYNSGLRYGMLGDGEGSTADPSLLRTWLAGSHVRCEYFSPGGNRHGVVLTSGWRRPAGWSLIEMDIFPNGWKINDFTFGTQAALYRAMQTARPILRYRG